MKKNKVFTLGMLAVTSTFVLVFGGCELRLKRFSHSRKKVEGGCYE